jgi:hypothetical protein
MSTVLHLRFSGFIGPVALEKFPQREIGWQGFDMVAKMSARYLVSVPTPKKRGQAWQLVPGLYVHNFVFSRMRSMELLLVEDLSRMTISSKQNLPPVPPGG